MAYLSPFNLLMLLVFVSGYFFITIEHIIKINKTSIALLMGIICWIFQFMNQAESQENNLHFLYEHLANISQVILFLLGALIIVEMMNAHKGFQFISHYIRIYSKRKLLWIIGGMTFFLSSMLDNLTTTIIMITLLRKLIHQGEDRLLMGGAVVIAANAGGAWTPIGDVTTTMLWIGGQLSTLETMKSLFIPSLVCLIVSLFFLSFFLKGEFSQISSHTNEKVEPMGRIVFLLGMGCLIFVPILKMLTGLPPFMGMIFGLSLMWLITDLIHPHDGSREHLKVPHIIGEIDLSSVLFFLGILLCVDALYTAGLLETLAKGMDRMIANSEMIAVTIGLLSAIIDNVPLVAAAMGMYDLNLYPADCAFWNLIAYCAGTGGSILIIGSAAGVAFMGLERVEFFWYMRRIGLTTLAGYFAGIGAFKLLH